MSPCRGCWEMFDEVELSPNDGRCGDCEDDQVPVRHELVMMSALVMRGEFDGRTHSRETAASFIRAHIADEAQAAE